MNTIIEIAPECPDCHTHHRQSFTPEDLRELLRDGCVSLYCPRVDKSWRATPEQHERLAHIAASFARLIQEGNSPTHRSA